MHIRPRLDHHIIVVYVHYVDHMVPIIFRLFKVEALTISVRLSVMIKGYGMGHCISHCVH